jgi:hypothetical protein
MLRGGTGMTNKESAFLAFKLLGLWLIASAVIGMASTPYIWQSTPEVPRGWTTIFFLLPSLVALGVGVPVWLSADWFADHVFPGTRASPAGSLRADVLFSVCVSVVGLFLLAEATPTVASGVFLWAHSLQSGILGLDVEQANQIWSAAAKATTVAAIVKLLIGGAFLAGPGRVTAAVARVRKEFRGSLVDAASDERGKAQ